MYHIMALYNRLLENPDLEVPSRTFVSGPKQRQDTAWLS